MSNEKQYAVVMTTVASEAAAAELATKVLARKLGACVQVQRVRSFYAWKGETCSDPEWLLFIKTRAGLYGELESFIRENHAYETPEIVQVPVSRGFAGYLRWIDGVTDG